jgi:hypothetical protein
MGLPEFIRTEILKYVDEISKHKDKNLGRKRNEEYNMYDLQKDYELEIKNAVNNGQIATIKKLYNELLEKFESKLEREVSRRVLKLLKVVTELIRKNLKGYNQEQIFQREFQTYERIKNKNELTPASITGSDSNLNFFEDKSFKDKVKTGENKKGVLEKYLMNPPTPYPNKENKNPIPLPNKSNKDIDASQKELNPQEAVVKYVPYGMITPENPYIQKLLKQIKQEETLLNKALIKEDLSEAQEYYGNLKKLFDIFPSEVYDLKIEIYSDILAANFKIHQLLNHLNKLNKMQEQHKYLEQKQSELLEIEKEKYNLKKEKLENEINNIKSNTNIRDANIKQEEVKADIPIPEVSELDKLKDAARLKRINHDKELLQNLKKEIKYNVIPLPSTNKKEVRIKSNKINQQYNQSVKIKKTNELIRNLYSDGIKRLFENNNNKAKTAFKKILDINPYYKPAIIRLEQINAQT